MNKWFYNIIFNIYKIKEFIDIGENTETGLKFYPNQLEPIGDSGKHIEFREITARFRVEPGYYLVIPSTFSDEVDLEFMLRIFTEQPVTTKFGIFYLFY